ncbi:MAG: BREX system ATP-binding domain-containing protein [Bacillota bacterium]
MTTSMQTQKWLQFIQREYLDSFVKEGGSAVKFAVPLVEQVRPVLAEGISQCAEERGYLVARVRADDTKVHMVDHIFFKVADQVPWQHLCQKVIVKLAVQQGYAAPSDGDGPLIFRIANENRIGPDMVRMELRRALEKQVSKHPKFSRDFRVAMTYLCLAELSGGEDGANTIQVLTDWLTGRNKAVGAVKPYRIFSQINRTNARYLFESLLRWVRFAGYPGMLIVLDTARLTLARNPRDEKLYYSKAAVLDAYEVLRQFIDGTDRLKGCFIVVIPDAAFLEENSSGRDIGAYQALKLRVIDEIRDRHLVNPLVSLVRLSSSNEGRGY